MKHNTNTLENVAVMTTGKDLVTSLLIVSVLINVAVFVAWLAVSLDPSVTVAILTR